MHREPVMVDLHRRKAACSTCTHCDWCNFGELSTVELHRPGAYVEDRRPIGRGDSLYTAGAPFKNLYCVRVGSIKTAVSSRDGREQVTGFHMPGDLIGLDGISTDIHHCAATALEDSEVCMIPFSYIEHRSSTILGLQRQMHRLLSSEVVRVQHKTLMLGTMRAEEKLAWFLLDLSVRYLKRGYSATEFVLRMTRREIGSFLGLEMETVSRLLSRFQDTGLVTVQQKHIKLLDASGLRELIGRSYTGSG